MRDDLARAYLNPALGAFVLRWFVDEYETKSDRSPDWMLSYVLFALVYHRPTRSRLPSSPRTHLSAWAENNATTSMVFPARLAVFADLARDSLIWAIRHDLVSLERGHLASSGGRLPSLKGLQDFRRAARQTAWLTSNVESTSTVYYLLGVRGGANANPSNSSV